MIQDKTAYFISLRKSPHQPSKLLSIDAIKSKLVSLNNSLALLENKLELSSLPDFGSRIRKMKEITDIRSAIEQTAKSIEQETKEFHCQDNKIQEAVQSYLLSMLSTSLSRFRASQQKSLTPEDEKYENNIGGNTDFEWEMAQETQQRNQSIKTSIFNITNTLVQLKLALKNQTGQIDSIDRCFEKTNVFLEQANKEIEKIPGRYCGFKDKIIYGLLYVICILLSMIIIKIYRKQDLKVENIEKYKLNPGATKDNLINGENK